MCCGVLLIMINRASPCLSIITVTYNAAEVVAKTIESVRRLGYKNYEYIVVDGASSDATNEVVRQYGDVVDRHVIEPDRGIYDAMNKAVRHAKGDWLIFMNAGDVFSSPAVLDGVDFSASGIDIYYSDTILSGAGGQLSLERADVARHRFNHQSFIYRRALHQRHGEYICHQGVTISDYLFLAPLWKASNSVKLEQPIAVFDCGGVSSGDGHFYQKIAVDLLFGFSSPSLVAWKIIIFPWYKRINQWLSRIRRC